MTTKSTLEFVGTLSLENNGGFASVRAPLPTTNGEWREVEIPLADFIPTSFGRRVQGMGPVEPSQINGLGLMLSDKQAGPFAMEVEWVKVERAER